MLSRRTHLESTRNFMSTMIHESSYVDEGARIGSQTKVWHFCHIMGSACIGDHCVIGQNVFVGDNVTIGDYVRIQNNVSVYSGVILEDYVFCGPSVVFTNVKNPRAKFPRRGPEDFLTTRVKLGATIGANATIVCGITLGEWSFIAAGAVVARDVPPYALIQGVPGVQAGWVCQCGCRLEDQNYSCQQCLRDYKLTQDNKLKLVNDALE